MVFNGFSKEGIAFLKALRENNEKEWFEERRDTYEEAILEPSKAYVEEMGEHLQALVPTIRAIPKVNKSLFRIYRDVRFSKNKTPIKTRIGVIFWQGNAKRMQSSAFYMHFDPEHVLFATGIRGFDKESLAAYREYIKEDNHREALHAILEDLKSKGYSLPEPAYKRLPREFDKAMSHSYLAHFDAMYAFKEELIPEVFFTEDLPDYAYAIYEDMADLQSWVYEMSLTCERE